MRPYISQPVGSNSCGAHSLAYYLWETKKSRYINDKSFVDALYNKIQIGPNPVGIPNNYSCLAKITNELKKNWAGNALICMSSDSSLEPIIKGLYINTENKDVFGELRNGYADYAIIICQVGTSQTLHAMLIKYEKSAFKLLDSNYSLDLVDWEDFSIGLTNELMLMRDSNYYYTGVGIIIV